MARKLPKMMQKMIVKELGTDFAKVTEIIQAPVPQPGPGQILVRNKYVGINATDVNYTAGFYNPTLSPPFGVGLEGLGEVVATGADTHVQVGQPVSYLGASAFADYTLVPVKLVAPLPELNPHFLPFMLSGLTAAISLDKVGEIKKGDKVLVTAAAGGTGQFAVQWCKNAGCEVIGTCSTDHKAQFLKSIGCDRAINYKKEDLNKVLQAEYPKGVDVVYESVGGDVFTTCVNNLARKGRLIVIGAISGYLAGIREQKSEGNLPLTLLTKSASLRGFLLNHYQHLSGEYMMKLVALYQQGKLTSALDMGENTPTGPFKGLQAVYAAEDYMHSSKNTGKVMVQLY